MHNRNKNALLGLLLASCSAPLAAQVISLEAMEISSAPIEDAVQRAHAERRNASNSKTVIEAEQLNQFGDQPLGDALRRLVGVSFAGANRARELQLRGIGPEYAQVLVNGRRILDANSKRSVQLDRIPSSLVERVEIIRSPLASQEGQGAAGTVNIILKQRAKSGNGEIGIGAGHMESNGGLGDATVFYSLGNDNVTLNLAGGVQLQRRNESKDSLVFSNSGANGGELGSNERRFEQGNFLPSLELRLNDDNRLNFQLDYLKTTEYRDDIAAELETAQNAVRRTEFEDRERKRTNLGLLSDWTHQWSDDTELLLSLDLQKADEDTTRDAKRYRANGTLDRTRLRDENIHMTSVSPTLKVKTLLDAHRLEWGAGARRETREEDNSNIENGVVRPINAARTYQIREDITHLFAQDTWLLPWGDSLTYGLRLEDAHTRTRDFNGAKQQTSKLSPLPSISYLGHLSANTDWRLGIARTLRRPDLRELSPTVTTDSGTLARPDTGGNPGMTPESIWGVDLGLDHFFNDQRGLLSANLFHRQFSDKIENVLSEQNNGRWLSRPENAGDGQASGLELEARAPMDVLGLPQLTLWSNATAVHTRLKSEATGETRRFLDQPDYLFNAGADYYLASLRTTFGINYNWNSGYNQKYRLTSGQTAEADQDAVGRVDISARTQLSENTSLNLSVLNLFAQNEDSRATTYGANGLLESNSLTEEGTYRTFYVRVQTAF